MYVFYIDDAGLQIPGLQFCANTSSWLLNLNPTLDILWIEGNMLSSGKIHLFYLIVK